MNELEKNSFLENEIQKLTLELHFKTNEILLKEEELLTLKKIIEERDKDIEKAKNKRIRHEKILEQAYKSIKQKEAELIQQKEEIQTQAEELFTLNEVLQEQSEKLEITNKELEKLSIVASKTDNAVMIMDKSGNFEWINEGFTRLYGYKLNEFCEKFGDNLLLASFNPNIKEDYDRCITEKVSVIYEFNSILPNGEKLWIQTTITPVFNEQNEIEKLIGIDTNISKLKEAETEIIKQHNELIDKNEKIKSSIRYAQTIQQAILPIKENIDKYFENFIIYRPKDIVSGDFYWFVHVPAETKDLFFIASADCTGHGVPGAFMSMICSRLLNEAVNEKKIHHPNEILEELDKNLKIALKQDQDKNNDGMDICLIRVDKTKSNNEIESINFCGAKRPLFHFKSETSEIIEFKADKRSIGGATVQKNKINFANQKIAVSKDDTIYLSTDGYTDQNNNSRKRLGTQMFTEILKEIGNLSLEEQKQHLEKYLSEYMNSEEQRDDITLIGLKFTKDNR